MGTKALFIGLAIAVLRDVREQAWIEPRTSGHEPYFVSQRSALSREPALCASASVGAPSGSSGAAR
jgi:hypothetical protein